MPAETLLIVDDSRLSRMMIRNFASHAQADWGIIEAENGEDALAKSESAPVTRMTVDYNMPGMDGLALAGKLRERFPEAKIAMLTANVQDAIRRRAEALGVGFIEKPVTEAKIVEFVTDRGEP